MLDPTRDYLIMLFPQGFWFDVALFCAIATAVGAIILGGIGWWLRRKKRAS
jgi:LPXTG-motif cell wall-anchored protein